MILDPKSKARCDIRGNSAFDFLCYVCTLLDPNEVQCYPKSQEEEGAKNVILAYLHILSKSESSASSFEITIKGVISILYTKPTQSIHVQARFLWQAYQSQKQPAKIILSPCFVVVNGINYSTFYAIRLQFERFGLFAVNLFLSGEFFIISGKFPFENSVNSDT